MNAEQILKQIQREKAKIAKTKQPQLEDYLITNLKKFLGIDDVILNEIVELSRTQWSASYKEWKKTQGDNL